MSSFSAFDRLAMARALELAAKGRYTTTPNPRVGCVVALNDQIIAEGYHHVKGGPHAEIEALSRVPSDVDLRDVTVYVTLEPCAHYGMTPPCAAALAQKQVKRVVSAMEDPNPQVRGKGFALLREHHIQVEVGLFAAQARELNRGFISRVTRRLPFSTLKIAMSLDGKIALKNGESQWITGEKARLDVQKLRAESSAVLTGIGTVLKDNPRLNVRAVPTSRQPIRIVLDSKLRIPSGAFLLTDSASPTWIVTLAADASRRLKAYPHVTIIRAQEKNGTIDLKALFHEFAALELNDLLIECGPTLAGSLLREQLIDELCCFSAPLILGSSARSAFTLPEITDLSMIPRWRLAEHKKIGDDIKLIFRPDRDKKSKSDSKKTKLQN